MLYDTHIHLDQYSALWRDMMLRGAFAAGVAGIVSVSMDAASCASNRALAQRYPGRVMPAYGYHPEQPPLGDAELDELCEWIRKRKDEPFAIGEVGLPYFARKEAEAQGEPFDEAPYVRQLERFVALAAELDRPIALHAVYEDADKAMELLVRHGVRKAHFHWFKGSPASVEKIVRAGYYLSITPDVLYEPDIRELVSVCPLDRLLTETDGPWPFEGPFDGRETEPGMVAEVVREIASLRGLDVRETERALGANARRLYGFQA